MGHGDVRLLGLARIEVEFADWMPATRGSNEFFVALGPLPADREHSLITKGRFGRGIPVSETKEDYAMQTTDRVQIINDGRQRAIPIPSDFNFPGDEVILRKEGRRLIVEPAFPTLLSTLATLETLDEDFPDVDDGLLPADKVEI